MSWEGGAFPQVSLKHKYNITLHSYVQYYKSRKTYQERGPSCQLAMRRAMSHGGTWLGFVLSRQLSAQLPQAMGSMGRVNVAS